MPCRVRPGNEIRHYRAITVKYWSKNARDKGKNPKKVIRISRFQVLILSAEFKRSNPRVTRADNDNMPRHRFSQGRVPNKPSQGYPWGAFQIMET